MTKFDQLFSTAVPLIRRGAHHRDTPPTEGGRWPVSVALRPPPDSPVSRRLDELTAEAAAIAGPGQWHTGQIGSAHLTVRALETYRAAASPTDAAVRRYQSALTRASADLSATRFEITGLTLTPGSVMACAVPLDDQADLLMDRLDIELGPDAWFERPHGRRDIWYLNLVHFITAIADPEVLITWVAARRVLDLGRITIGTAELVRFRYAPGLRPHMRPEALGRAHLSVSGGHQV